VPAPYQICAFGNAVYEDGSFGDGGFGDAKFGHDTFVDAFVDGEFGCNDGSRGDRALCKGQLQQQTLLLIVGLRCQHKYIPVVLRTRGVTEHITCAAREGRSKATR